MNEKINLEELNKQFSAISNEIESKMNFLQRKYDFSLDYAFKPITEDEVKNFNSLKKPKFK